MPLLSALPGDRPDFVLHARYDQDWLEFNTRCFTREALDAAKWSVTIPPSGPSGCTSATTSAGHTTLIKRLMPWNTRRLERMAYIAATTTTYPQP
jgi:hypothetical protein